MPTRLEGGPLMRLDERRVYLMDCDGWTKVGISTRPLKRLKMIQSHNPYRVVLSSVLPTDDAGAVEDLLHDFMHAYHAHGGGREWFDIPDEVHADLCERELLLTDDLTLEWCDSLDGGLHPIWEEGTHVDPSPKSVMFDIDADRLDESDPRHGAQCSECGESLRFRVDGVIQDGVSSEFKEETASLCIDCVLRRYPAGIPFEIPVSSDGYILSREGRRMPYTP